MKLKRFFFYLFLLISFSSYSQATFLRIELDVKEMLNPSCNLNMGNVDSNKVYVHMGLCSCSEQVPFGPAYRDCTDPVQNELFCTSQITPFQSRVWQHVVGNWGTTPLDDGIGLMTYEGDSIWSFEIIIEDYFSDLNLVQDTTFGNDSSIAFHSGLIPYTIGLVFRNKDGFYSGRDNGCNDIFITNLQGGNPVVIQSTDLSTYDAITVQMTSLSSNDIKEIRNLQIYPNPINGPTFIRFTLQNYIENCSIDLYDMNGKIVYQLYNGSLNSGNHEFRWDGLVNGKSLPSSNYIMQIKSKQYVVSEKILIN